MIYTTWKQEEHNNGLVCIQVLHNEPLFTSDNMQIIDENIWLLMQIKA